MFLSEMEGPESQLYVPDGPEKGTASSPLGKMLDRNPPQKKDRRPGRAGSPLLCPQNMAHLWTKP